MVSTPRRRAWGRPKHRDAITLVDEMEIDLAEKESRELKRNSSNAEPDLQHPEIMSNDELIAILGKMKVPIPVYPNGDPSRERLLYLFRRHVTPRPQRTRRMERSRRRGETGATPTEAGTGMEWSKSVRELVQESPENERKRSNSSSPPPAKKLQESSEVNSSVTPDAKTTPIVRKLKRPRLPTLSSSTKMILCTRDTHS